MHKFTAFAGIVLFCCALSGCGSHTTANTSYRGTTESAAVNTSPEPKPVPVEAPAANGAMQLTDQSFASEISSFKGVALVDFNAKWCAPCRRMAPIVDDLALELAAEAKIAKLDIDANWDTATKFDVHSIPCFMLFNNGQEVGRRVGPYSKENLKAWVLQYSGMKTAGVP